MMTFSADCVSAPRAALSGSFTSVLYAPPKSPASLTMTCGPRKNNRRQTSRKPGNAPRGGDTGEGAAGIASDPTKKQVEALVDGFGGAAKVRSASGSVGSSGGGFGTSGKKEESMTWRCVTGCGACCKLRKGPEFPTYAEIFSDVDPQLAEMVESMIGDDGWCNHYDHNTRTCSIYHERPFFCRVDPEVFFKLYGIDHKSYNSEACRACRDTIKRVYGLHSEELKSFNAAISNRNSIQAPQYTT